MWSSLAPHLTRSPLVRKPSHRTALVRLKCVRFSYQRGRAGNGNQERDVISGVEVPLGLEIARLAGRGRDHINPDIDPRQAHMVPLAIVTGAGQRDDLRTDDAQEDDGGQEDRKDNTTNQAHTETPLAVTSNEEQGRGMCQCTEQAVITSRVTRRIQELDTGLRDLGLVGCGGTAMFGEEMMAQNDTDAAPAVAAANLLRERLAATPAACAADQGAGIEEAQSDPVCARHLRAAFDQPHQEAIGWTRGFDGNGWP